MPRAGLEIICFAPQRNLNHLQQSVSAGAWVVRQASSIPVGLVPVGLATSHAA